MKEQNHNFEDFLRKKLHEIGGNYTDWDKPDAEVWKAAKQHISSFGMRKRIVLTILILLFSLGILLLLGLWIGNLKIKVTQLNEELTVQKMALQQACTDLNELQTRLNQELIFKSRTQEKINPKSKIFKAQTTGIYSPANPEFTSIPQIQTNQFLSWVVPTDTIDAITQTNLESKALAEYDTIANEQNLPFLYPNKVPILQNNQRVLTLLTRITPLKNKPHLFELGYSHGVMDFKFHPKSNLDIVPISSNFEYPGMAVKETSNEFYLAYSPIRNWWVKLGFSDIPITLEYNEFTIFPYDKSKESISFDNALSPNGFIGQVSINHSSFVNSDIESILYFYHSSNFMDGDRIPLSYKVQDKFRLLHIPLNMEHRFGNTRVQGLIYSGLSWNQIRYEDFIINDLKNTGNKKSIITEIETNPKSRQHKQYFGAQAGLGLNYHFSKHWFARVDLLYRVDAFHHYRDFKLGLGHRFKK